MSANDTEFLKNLKNMLWKAFGGLLLLVVISVVPFYFNTKNEINNLKEQTTELRSSKADKAIYEITVTQIQKELEKINNKLDGL